MNYAQEGGQKQWNIGKGVQQQNQQHLKRSIRASISEPLEDFCYNNQVPHQQENNNPASSRGLQDKSDDKQMFGKLRQQQNPQAARNDASASTNQKSQAQSNLGEPLQKNVNQLDLDQINEEAEEERKIQPVVEVNNDSDSDSCEQLPLHLLNESDSFEWPDYELQASPKRLVDKQKEFPHMAHLDNYHPPSFKVPIELLKQTPGEDESEEEKDHKSPEKKRSEKVDNCLKESAVVKHGTLHTGQKICYDVLDDNDAQQNKNPFHTTKKPKKGWIFIDQPSKKPQ